MDGQTPRKSWKRRLVRALAVGLIGVVALVAALPWLLALPPARSALVKAVNRAIPGRVSVSGISASWFGSVRLTGLVLRDAGGKTLIDARSLTVDRGLMALALRPMRVGTVTVDGATVNIERRADGSIDLVDALVRADTRPEPAQASQKAPARSGPPTSGSRGALDVTLRVVHSSLVLRSPELAAPIEAKKLELEVHPPAAFDELLTWRVRLAEPPGGTPAETLGLDGTFDLHAAADPDLSVAIKAARWPLTLAGASFGADVEAKTRLDGQLKLDRHAGRWTTGGDARLFDLDAAGPVLAGDHLLLDQVVVAWDVEQTASAWSVRQVKLKSPVGDLFARGETGASRQGPTARLEATVDLAGLARRVPHALRLREGLPLERGTARVTAELTSPGADRKASVEAWLSDLSARDKAHAFTLRDPATLTARGTFKPNGFNVETLTVKAAAVDIKGSGDLEHGLVLNGQADLGALQAQFKDLIDFGAVAIAGKVRMVGDYRRGTGPKGAAYVARYAAEVRGLKMVGLTAEPLVRESARFDATASGPIAPTGLPAGLAGARVNLKSPRDEMNLTATSKDGTMALSGVVSVPLSALPVKVLERDGQLGLRVIGRYTDKPSAVEVDQLNLLLVPADPALAGDGTVSLGLRGRLDFDADTLTLSPLPPPGGKVPALALAPEGVALRGVLTTPITRRAGKARFVGDVAALDRAKAVWMAGTPMGLAGSLSIQVVLAAGNPGQLHVGAQVQVPDLSRAGSDGKGRRSEGPVTLTLRGTYQPEPGSLAVDEVDVNSRYAVLQATGRLDDLSGRVVADLNGTLAPNWSNVTRLAAEMVEPGMRLTGGSRPFHVKGPLAGASAAGLLLGLDAELGLDLTSADAFGLKLGPAPLVVRCGQGKVTVDPISTTLNGGQVELRPGLDVDETRGIALLLGKGSAVHDAAINDEVSRRLLRYVAPVLDQATHVNGTVSLAVDRGDFPLVACPPDRRVNMTGLLSFQNVVFAPGQFATQVLSLTGQPGTAGLRLHQPVQLSIADGKVTQKGLEIPVQRGVTVGLEGAVGFDQTLDLKAHVPLTHALLGPAAKLDPSLATNRITVPIGGTVSHPRVNRQALQVALKELSRGALQRELTGRAAGVIDQLAPPPAAAGPAGTNAPQGRTADPLNRLGNQLLRRLAPRGNDTPPPPAPDRGPGR